MKTHPVIGSEYIKKIIDEFEDDEVFSSYIDFLKIPYEICMYHHERWDGNGYPDGLKGSNIPICARIISIVDAYDAMRAQRSYNVQKSHEECIDVIISESGKQFDPEIVKAFLNIEKKFDEIQYV